MLCMAGGVEESGFCLLLVVFPVMCINSISPRFYFRKCTFCFLPLVAILESPSVFLFNLVHQMVPFNGGIKSISIKC
jgi:hypothetical protein